ncbi:MAG TPA: hypothetical protein VER55_06610, partial [Ardenticatenaceae bacterium]|nr:hypothetical protein [Ardenticatenaceae bacterium]
MSLVTLGLGLLGTLSPRTLGAVAIVGVVMGGHSSMRLLGKSIMDFRDLLSTLGRYRVCIAGILLFG